MFQGNSKGSTGFQGIAWGFQRVLLDFKAVFERFYGLLGGFQRVSKEFQRDVNTFQSFSGTLHIIVSGVSWVFRDFRVTKEKRELPWSQLKRINPNEFYLELVTIFHS